MCIPSRGSAANHRLSVGRGGRQVYLSGGLIREGPEAVSQSCRPVPMGTFASSEEDVAFPRPFESATMNSLTWKCVPRLDGVSPAELGRLFPGPSITAPLLSLLQESGIDGFNLRSIVVLKDDAPILLLPLFETRFDLSTFVE